MDCSSTSLEGSALASVEPTNGVACCVGPRLGTRETFAVLELPVEEPDGAFGPLTATGGVGNFTAYQQTPDHK
jgi:hypothetical protein